MKWLLFGILGLLGIVLVFLIVPVGAILIYDNGNPSAFVRVFGIRFKLYPPRPKKIKKAKAPKEDKGGAPAKAPGAAKDTSETQRAEKPPASPESKKSASADKKSKKGKPSVLDSFKGKLSVEDISKYLRFALDSAKRVLNGIWMPIFELRAVIGLEDAANTALAYGGAWAAVSTLLPPLEECFHIRRKEIDINASFEGQESLFVKLEVNAILLRLLIAGIIIYRAFKKLIDNKAVQHE